MQTTQSWRFSLNRQCWTAFRFAGGRHVRRSFSVQAGIASGTCCQPRGANACGSVPHAPIMTTHYVHMLIGDPTCACRPRAVPARCGARQPDAESGATVAGAAGAGPDRCVTHRACTSAPSRYPSCQGPIASSPDSQRRTARLRGVHVPAAVFSGRQHSGRRPSSCADDLRGAGSVASCA
jgi:hypothetical protein